jgi:iron complex transport system substrate-binding protein
VRIASLLPSATEIVCALGLTDSLVGVTHECDYPPAVRGKPVLTASRIHGEALTSAEIEHAVSTRLGGHQSLYSLDEERLRALRPHLVLTQELCAVCAVSYADVQHAAARMLDVGTRVVSLEPTTLEEVFGTIELVGALTDRSPQATELVVSLRARVAAVRDRLGPRSSRPRVWVCEWLDPPYSAGHWVSAQVEAAGGREVFQRVGLPSTRVAPGEVVDQAPEVIVLAPCGFHVDDVERETGRVAPFPGWDDLPAVKRGEVWAVDASSYYSRPGPRLVGGVELLAGILHPEVFGAPDPRVARRVTLGRQPLPA